MEAIGLTASFFMGIVLGMMGGGGSILTVPLLVYFFGLPPTIATGHSLFVVGLTALIGSTLSFRKAEVDFRTGLTFAFPSVLGVNVSRGWILPNIPETLISWDGIALTREILIMLLFAVLMIVASFSMIKGKRERKLIAAHPFSRLVLIALQGLFVGLVAGFVGAGGGFLIIPALALLAGLSMKIAIGTSLMIIALQSLLGFAGDLSRGMVADWFLLGKVAVLAAVGIGVGSKIGDKINETRLKVAFGWFVLFMGIFIFTEQVRQASF